VNEGVAALAEETMRLEFRLELLNRTPKVRCRVVVMVEMKLDLAIAALAELRERLEKLRRVLLGREKPCVLRRTAIRIAKSVGHARIILKPVLDTAERHLTAGLAPERLEVVAEAE
jgi:hypothetical protein